VISSFALACNEQRLFFEVQEGRHPLPNQNVFSGDVCIMLKHAAIILSAATLSFGLAMPPKAFADDMKKDTMSKDTMSKDTMSKDAMSKDTMSKDTMSKDTMKKDGMSNDSMMKDSMKKDDLKKN
jgi:pentapeptide MXKDX repeat protein